MPFKHFWENVNDYTFPAIKQSLPQNAKLLLASFLREIVTRDEILVDIGGQAGGHYADLRYDNDNTAKQFCLRLHGQEKFEVCVECYIGDELVTAVYELTAGELAAIPVRLKKAMQKAYATGKKMAIHQAVMQVSY